MTRTPIQTKNIPFRAAPEIPTYAMPWHEYVNGKGVVALARAIGLSESVRAGRNGLRVQLQPLLKGGAGLPDLDFRVERLVVQTPFVIDAVTVDDYLCDGATRDPGVDFAHAGELKPFRVFDIVPRVCRAGAWIAVDIKVDPSASLHEVAMIIGLERVAAFGAKIERVCLGGVTTGKVYA